MEVFDGCNLSLQQDSLSPGLSAEASGYWVAFNRVLGIGPVNFRLLLNAFQNDLAVAWRADSRELARAGLHQKTIDAFLTQRVKIEPERGGGVSGESAGEHSDLA